MMPSEGKSTKKLQWAGEEVVSSEGWGGYSIRSLRPFLGGSNFEFLYLEGGGG